MKKILSVLLVIACILTMTGTSIAAFADDSAETAVLYTAEQEELNPADDESEILDEPEHTLDEYEYVVTMYLCSTANSFTGHVWLYFVNLTECEVPIGNIMLEPGEEMSVGSLSYFKKGGGGTYYNGEAKMATQKGIDKVCQHTTSLEMNLTVSQLEKVNKKIKSLNFYMFTLWNCGCFATQVWNCVSDKDVVHIVLPVFTVLNMRILGAKKGVVKMQEVTNVYKQTKDGYKDLGDYIFSSSCV